MKFSLPNKPILSISANAAGLAYPFAITAAWKWGFLNVVVLIGGIVALRWFAARRAAMSRAGSAMTGMDAFALPALVAGVLTLGLAIARPESGPLFYPAFMSIASATAFGTSLYRERSLVEALSAPFVPSPPPFVRLYMRRVTLVWCIFLSFNALVSIGTIIYGDREVWLFYNGFLSYVLMGALLAVEYAVRRVLQARAPR